VVVALGLLGCGGCRSEHRFESACQLIRHEVVERDARGVPVLVDIELEWDACPGDQFQVIRGGREFARCMARYRLGDLLNVRVLHWWDTRGYYTWDVYQVGECSRPIEPESAGSFERSQECSESHAHGVVNGFQCSRLPHRTLAEVCPWTVRQ
jgi:hypothetical protein